MLAVFEHVVFASPLDVLNISQFASLFVLLPAFGGFVLVGVLREGLMKGLLALSVCLCSSFTFSISQFGWRRCCAHLV